jgi:hypothetical protein
VIVLSGFARSAAPGEALEKILTPSGPDRRPGLPRGEGGKPAISRRSEFFSIAAVQPGPFSIPAIQSAPPDLFA